MKSNLLIYFWTFVFWFGNMPFKCCVPNCKGNYATGPKVSTFAFPKDENLRGKWIQAIKRIDFIPTNTSKVPK